MKKQDINEARRRGDSIDTQLKRGAATNKQHVPTNDLAKLDGETEALKHETISRELGQLIQKARTDKKMTQKELAMKINEKHQVINDYENGKAILNQTIIVKIEKVLGEKLQGRERGKQNVSLK